MDYIRAYTVPLSFFLNQKQQLLLPHSIFSNDAAARAGERCGRVVPKRSASSARRTYAEVKDEYYILLVEIERRARDTRRRPFSGVAYAQKTETYRRAGQKRNTSPRAIIGTHVSGGGGGGEDIPRPRASSPSFRSVTRPPPAAHDRREMGFRLFFIFSKNDLLLFARWLRIGFYRRHVRRPTNKKTAHALAFAS